MRCRGDGCDASLDIPPRPIGGQGPDGFDRGHFVREPSPMLEVLIHSGPRATRLRGRCQRHSPQATAVPHFLRSRLFAWLVPSIRPVTVEGLESGSFRNSPFCLRSVSAKSRVGFRFVIRPFCLEVSVPRVALSSFRKFSTLFASKCQCQESRWVRFVIRPFGATRAAWTGIRIRPN